MNVILIDDDDDLCELLTEYLSHHGITLSTASNGKEGLARIAREDFSLAILDVMMPEMDGLEVLKVINAKYEYLPVIMLTAKYEEIDRILGLELGAIDYVAKPFSPRELLARIKAIISREEKIKKKVLMETGKSDKSGDNIKIYGEKSNIISSNHIKIDLKRRTIHVRGSIAEFSSQEFELLAILVENKGIVLSRERIMDLMKGKEFIAYDRSIDVAVSRVRQKIEEDPQNPKLIKTVRGAGYIYSGD